jgi:hypothetical protein
MAHAGIIVQDYWQLGAADPGAASGHSGASTTVNSVSGGESLSAYGSSTTYTGNASPGSLLAMSFGGASGYAGSVVLGGTTDGYGIEIWADPTSAPAVGQGEAVFYNGDTSQSGWGIYLTTNNLGDTDWYMLIGGVAVSFGAPVTLDTWSDVAVVSVGGVASFYLNGVAEGGTYFGGNTHPPSGGNSFALVGMNQCGTGFGCFYTSEYFTGNLDDARIFTIDSNGFAPSDLNSGVPEPSSLALMGLGAVALAGWMRRRRAAR